jgi:hypothetical protein
MIISIFGNFHFTKIDFGKNEFEILCNINFLKSNFYSLIISTEIMLNFGIWLLLIKFINKII